MIQVPCPRLEGMLYKEHTVSGNDVQRCIMVPETLWCLEQLPSLFGRALCLFLLFFWVLLFPSRAPLKNKPVTENLIRAFASKALR